jgi:DNA (cytosine-5)-methyltransferase 1
MTDEITSGHLCSGYDGLGRGLALIKPHRALWHAEVDPDMSTVLAKHEPDVRNVGDLTTAPWHLAPRPTVVTAGIPCQPISGAGRSRGEDDERYLWPYAADIFRIVRPPFILLENVQRLTSMKLNDGTSMLARWLGDLRDARYAVTWTVVGACAVGAPHHRHRFYAWCRHVPAGPVREAIKIDTPCGAPRSGGRVLLPTPVARDGGLRGTPSRAHAQRRFDNPERSVNLEDAVTLLPVRPSIEGIATLLPTPVARDGDGRGEGSPEYWDARAGDRANGLPLGAVAGLLPTPRASVGTVGGPRQRNGRGEHDALPGLVVNMLPTPTTSNAGGNKVNNRGDILLPGVAVRPERWGRYAEAVALWEQVTGVPAPEPTEPNTTGGRRMSPLLPEWMMGLPTGLLTGHLPRAAAIKGAGNGAVPLQAAAAQRLLAAADIEAERS